MKGHQKSVFLFPKHGYLTSSKYEFQLLILLLMTLKSILLGQTPLLDFTDIYIHWKEAVEIWLLGS